MEAVGIPRKILRLGSVQALLRNKAGNVVSLLIERPSGRGVPAKKVADMSRP